MSFLFVDVKWYRVSFLLLFISPLILYQLETMSITITKTSPRFTFDQEAVNAALRTEAKQENAADAFTTSLNSEVVKKRAYDDVKELAKTIREIRTRFSTINLSLLGFDNEKFKDENGKVLQLGGEWKKRIDVSLIFFSACPN